MTGYHKETISSKSLRRATDNVAERIRVSASHLVNTASARTGGVAARPMRSRIEKDVFWDGESDLSSLWNATPTESSRPELKDASPFGLPRQGNFAPGDVVVLHNPWHELGVPTLA